MRTKHDHRVERRARGTYNTLRRDINDLVRDDRGKVSPFKIGGLIGQWLSVKLILQHGAELIKTWETLTVLFTVLIMPAVFRKVVESKFGIKESESVTTTTTASADVVTTTKGKK